MPSSLEHVTFAVADIACSGAFYDAAFGALGLARITEFGDEEEQDSVVEAIAWGTGDRVVLWVLAAATGSEVTRHAHLRIACDTRAEVDAFHEAGVKAGGQSRAMPRRWVIFRRGEFSAAVQDPDGNTVEAVSGE